MVQVSVVLRRTVWGDIWLTFLWLSEWKSSSESDDDFRPTLMTAPMILMMTSTQVVEASVKSLQTVFLRTTLTQTIILCQLNLTSLGWKWLSYKLGAVRSSVQKLATNSNNHQLQCRWLNLSSLTNWGSFSANGQWVNIFTSLISSSIFVNFLTLFSFPLSFLSVPCSL